MADQTAEPTTMRRRGFYPDPDDADRLRWWTGKQWGTSTAGPGGQPIEPTPQTPNRVWTNLVFLFVALIALALILSQTFGAH